MSFRKDLDFFKILKDCFRVIIHPGRVFKEIKEGGISPYFSLLFLFFLRYIHIYLHILLAHQAFFLQYYSGNIFELITDRFVIKEGGFYAWSLLFGSMVLYLVGRALKRNVNYKAIENGFFYILVAPVLLIVFDFPHFFTPSIQLYVFDRCMHISLILALILAPVWMSLLIERFLKIKKRYTILPAVLFPVSIKYFGGEIGALWPVFIPSLSLSMIAFFSIKKMKIRAIFSLITLLFSTGFYIMGF